jgi:hypothetical protein
LHVPQIEKALIAQFPAGGLFLMLCVVQWFAWFNFRRHALSARRIVVHLLVIFFALGSITLVLTLVIVAVFLRH